VDDQAKAVQNFATNQEKYKAALAKYKNGEKAKEEVSRRLRRRGRLRPSEPLTGSHAPFALYNGMISP